MRLHFPKRTEACLFTLTEGSLERSLGKEKRREKLFKRKWTRDRLAVCMVKATFGFSRIWVQAESRGNSQCIRVKMARVKYS